MGIPENELIKFVFTKKEFHNLCWKDQGKEFIYEGKMYDVVRIEAVNNTMSVFCFHDSEESKLFARLNEHINNYISTDCNTKNKTWNLLQKLNIDFQLPTICLPTNYHHCLLSNEPIFLTIFYRIYLSVDTPPPKT